MSAEVKRCKDCHTEKPLSDFLIRCDTRRPMSNCRLCYSVKRAAFDRKQYAKRRAAAGLQCNTATAMNNAFNLWHHPVNRNEPLRPRP